ncbi:MAG: hypothetical protein IJA69_02790 [Clostridia bacterium]|nr:hypothetical protein [Clostridia bacterium]
MGEISYGSYTTIKKQGDELCKQIHLDKLSQNQKIILNDIECSRYDIEHYQQLLIEDNFPLEPAYDFAYKNNSITFKQKYIDSKNVDELLEYCYHNNNYKNAIKIFEDVFCLWIYSHQNKHYYVDYNLRNFVYKNGKLTLIDIYPPLISDNIKQPSNQASKNQIELWTNKYVNLASLICYFVQGIIQDKIDDKNIEKLNKILNNIFEIINKKANIEKNQFIKNVKNTNHVFANRFMQLLDICEGKNKDINQFINAILF